MTQNSSPITDYFEIARSFATAQRRSARDFMQIDALAIRLLGSGMLRDDPKVCLWLEAALCADEAEVAALREMFAASLSQQETEESAVSSPGVTSEEGDRTGTWREHFESSWSLYASLLALTVVAVVAIVFGSGGEPPVPPLAEGQDDQEIVAPPPSVAEPIKLELIPDPTQVFIPERLIWLLLIPLVLALLYLAWRDWNKRTQLNRSKDKLREQKLSLSHEVSLEPFFLDRSIRKDVRRLGLHRLGEGDRIDTVQSVRDTVEAGGFPTLAFADIPRTPAYIVIIERESQADHLTVLARAFVKRMMDEDVELYHYEFFGSPETLVEIRSSGPARTVRLSDALVKHADANVLLCMERFDLERFETREPWFKELARSHLPALFNPNQSAPLTDRFDDRDHREFLIFPFSASGLERYASYVQSSGEEHSLSNDLYGAYDLPASLAEDRAVLLSSSHPDPVFATYLATQLRGWLGAETMPWLRGLALLPYVDPAFTIHLGQQLSDANGEPLLNAERFFKLVRLPWLRAGKFPDWVRRVLVSGFGEDGKVGAGDGEAQLAAVRDAIVGFLSVADTKEGKPSAEITSKDRQTILDWLENTPANLLHDALLLEVMQGAKPSELAVEAPRNWKRTRIERFSKLEVALGMTAAFNILAFAYSEVSGSNWLMEEQEAQPASVADLSECVTIEGERLAEESWLVEFRSAAPSLVEAKASVIGTTLATFVVDGNDELWLNLSSESSSDVRLTCDFLEGLGLDTVCYNSEGSNLPSRLVVSLTSAANVAEIRNIRVCGLNNVEEILPSPNGSTPTPPPVATPTPSPSPPAPPPNINQEDFLRDQLEGYRKVARDINELFSTLEEREEDRTKLTLLFREIRATIPRVENRMSTASQLGLFSLARDYRSLLTDLESTEITIETMLISIDDQLIETQPDETDAPSAAALQEDEDRRREGVARSGGTAGERTTDELRVETQSRGLTLPVGCNPGPYEVPPTDLGRNTFTEVTANAVSIMEREYVNCGNSIVLITGHYYESKENGSGSEELARARATTILNYLMDRNPKLAGNASISLQRWEEPNPELARPGSDEFSLSQATIGAAQRENDVNTVTIRFLP